MLTILVKTLETNPKCGVLWGCGVALVHESEGGVQLWMR
jgi:hypothetical protein